MSTSENKESALSLLGPLARQWSMDELPRLRQSLDRLGESQLTGDQQGLVDDLSRMARGFQQLLRLGLSLSPDMEGGSFDLEAEYRQRQAALQRMAHSRGLTLRTQFDGLIAQHFQGRVDEALLVLEVLIERALHQVKEGGVDVAIRGIDSAMGYRVEFRIMDSGPGMSLKAQDDLWVQAQDWNKEPERLVLNLLKRRVEEVGGGMGVDSKEGVGSCFWFEWPLIPVEPQEEQEEGGLATREQVFIKGGGAHQFRSLSIRLEGLGYLSERLPEDPSTLLIGGAEMEDLFPPMLVIVLLKESGTAEDQLLEEMIMKFPSMRVMVVVDKGVRGDSNYYQVLGACSYLVQSLPPESMRKMLEKMLEWEQGDPLITKNDLS